MIFYFIAGFISGAIGVMLFSHWLVKTGRIKGVDDNEKTDRSDIS